MTGLNIYENTLIISIADKPTDEDIPSDFLLAGDLKRVAAALAVNMQRYPELLMLIEDSLTMYDKLISS